MKDEALRLALEGFENIRHHFDTDEYAYEVAVKSITAIKQALEQPEPEPVAWLYESVCGNDFATRCEPPSYAKNIRPLYTFPPKREWQGLTDDEIDQGLLRSNYAFKTAEAWRAGVFFAMTKLKEKNNG